MDNLTYQDENIKNVDLPKWPAFVVCGKKVTERQAAEIVIRTDSHVPDFTYACNDSGFCYELNDLFGIPEFSMQNEPQDVRSHFAKIQMLKQELGIVEVDFLANNQIASAYIGGPHGWCNWNGDIFCNDYNIGKWPDVDEVAEEWAQIAKAFPFLQLTCQLFTGEHCDEDAQPAVQFDVANGYVTVKEPEQQLAPPVSDTYGSIMGIMLGTRNEQGIPVDALREKIEQIYGSAPQYNEMNVEE